MAQKDFLTKALLGLAIFVGLLIVASAFFIPKIAMKNYSKFANKAKGAEAKVALATLYQNNKAFYVEYGTYTTDLVALGTAQKPKDWIIGFVRESGETKVGGVENYDPTRRLLIPDGIDAKIVEPYLKKIEELCPDCTASTQGFKAIAILMVGYTKESQAWTIDDKKNLVEISVKMP
jgi:hypothetical protein